MRLTTRRDCFRFVIVGLVLLFVSIWLGVKKHEAIEFALISLGTQIVYAGLMYSQQQGFEEAERYIDSIKDRDEALPARKAIDN